MAEKGSERMFKMILLQERTGLSGKGATQRDPFAFSFLSPKSVPITLGTQFSAVGKMDRSLRRGEEGGAVGGRSVGWGGEIATSVFRSGCIVNSVHQVGSPRRKDGKILW